MPPPGGVAPPVAGPPKATTLPGPIVNLGGRQIPAVLLGGIAAIAVLAVVLIVVLSGGSSGNYSNARDLAQAISDNGAGCDSPHFESENTIGSVATCRVGSDSIEIAYITNGMAISTALAEARVSGCDGGGFGSQLYYVSGDKWEISGSSRAALEKVADALDGTVNTLC
jgi:hypothetical protein